MFECVSVGESGCVCLYVCLCICVYVCVRVRACVVCMRVRVRERERVRVYLRFNYLLALYHMCCIVIAYLCRQQHNTMLRRGC